MALTFPQNPTNGQIYGQYIFDSVSGTWKIYDNEYGLINVLATKANLSGGNTFSGVQNFTGIVSNTGRPSFSAYASAATLDATRTMPYDNARVNVGGYYNTSTYRFTAPVAGTYLFSIYDIGFAGYTTRFDLMKNGASQEDAGNAHQLRANNTTDYSTATSFWVVNAAVNDYFEVRIYAGRSHGTVEYSWFQGFLIG